MKQIVLKVDVGTCEGAVHGVPALLDLFKEFDVKASFLFSIGPDHTGRAIRHIFRKENFNRGGRPSLMSHYGIKTRLYGTLLPGPHIGRSSSDVLQKTIAEGHEVGIHGHDRVLWQDYVARKDYDWTLREMSKAIKAFICATRLNPCVTGAAGWQVNRYVIALEEKLGFKYASDVRGQSPFFPTMGGLNSNCIQLPTTLPTLDETLATNNCETENCWKPVFEKSREQLPHGHVYTLRAELEGLKLIPAMRKLLQHWTTADFEFLTLGQLHGSIDRQYVPTHSIKWGHLEGAAGLLAMQGPELLNTSGSTGASISWPRFNDAD